MKTKDSGTYTKYEDKEFRLVRRRREEDWKPIGYYIGIREEKYIDERCIEQYPGTEYAYYARPVTSDEIEYLYEINHYVICNGRKYKHFDYFPNESGLWIYAADWGKDEEIDPNYEVVERSRDGIYIKVPYDEVTLYETKTYYDKEKFINENKRVVLSEETYLIDEPWWLEENQNN